MLKKIGLALLGPFITYGASYWYIPTVTDCARASHVVYHTDLKSELNKHFLDQYELLDDINNEEYGMRIMVLRLRQTNNLLIVYRGTQATNRKNLLIDLGLGLDVLDDESTSEYLSRHAQTWLNQYSGAVLETLTATGTFCKNLISEKTALATLKMIGIDFDQAKKFKNSAIIAAFKQFQQIRKKYSGFRYFISGHSLGGFYAQLIGYHYGYTTYTFNAPGAHHTYKKLFPKWHPIKKRIRSKRTVTNFVRVHDLVGTFGEHLGTVTMVPNINGESTPTNDVTKFSDKLWLMYELPTYIQKNHAIYHMIDDLHQETAQA